MSFGPHSNRFNSHSHRFDMRRPFPVIENDEEEMFEMPDTCRRSSDEYGTNDPPERDFDLALEQRHQGRPAGARQSQAVRLSHRA
jgi:hypothetical protein